MNGAINIIRKELTRVFSDKKMIISLFVMPAILVVGIYYLMGIFASSMANDIESHIPTVYIQNAPETLSSYIEGADFTGNITYLSIGDDVSDIKDQIVKGDFELLVIFDDEFESMIAAYENNGDPIPNVTTYYNSSEDYSSSAKAKFDTVLSSYQQQLLANRLGNLEILTVFHVVENEIYDAQSASGQFLGMMLPYLITLLLFTTAMSLGIDAIAGEKERGTLASMLLTPMKRSELVFGKLVSLGILATLSAGIYVIAMVVAMPMMMKNMSDDIFGNMSISFSFVQILQLLIIMILLVYLYVGIVGLVSAYSKDIKTASSYSSPVMMLVLVCGMMTMFQGSSEVELFKFAIPIYGNALAIQKILVNGLEWSQFLINISGTAIVAIIVTGLITKAFNSEKIMFNA